MAKILKFQNLESMFSTVFEIKNLYGLLRFLYLPFLYKNGSVRVLSFPAPSFLKMTAKGNYNEKEIRYPKGNHDAYPRGGREIQRHTVTTIQGVGRYRSYGS